MDTRALAGTAVWIWNLQNCDGGDYDAIAARCHANGVGTVLIKASDGGNWFFQRQAGSDRIIPATEFVPELQKRGLKVITWSYDYDNGVAEAQRVIETVQAAKPDGHIFDEEAEVEGTLHPDSTALAFVSMIRLALGPDFLLAYAPLPAIDYHLRFPYRQFTDAGLPMLPQLYWTGLGWSMQRTVDFFYAGVEKYVLGSQPIYPAYEDAPGVQPTIEDVVEFVRQIKARGATGLSVWSYEHLDTGGWQRVAAAARELGPLPAPQPTPVPTVDPCAETTAKLLAAEAKLAALTAEITQVDAAFANLYAEAHIIAERVDAIHAMLAADTK